MGIFDRVQEVTRRILDGRIAYTADPTIYAEPDADEGFWVTWGTEPGPSSRWFECPFDAARHFVALEIASYGSSR